MSNTSHRELIQLHFTKIHTVAFDASSSRTLRSSTRALSEIARTAVKGPWTASSIVIDLSSGNTALRSRALFQGRLSPPKKRSESTLIPTDHAAAMSYKRHHTDVSTGGAGNQMPSARRPSTETTIFKRETFDDSLPEESKSQRTPSDGAESDASSDRPGRARKKAEPVKSACVQCQKRKTKCSGQRPVCRFCSDRNLECSWDIGDGLTRTADLKQKLQEANLKSEDLSELVSAMRTGTDQTSSMLLARLRLGCSTEELLSNIRLDESSGESRQGSMDQQMMAR